MRKLALRCTFLELDDALVEFDRRRWLVILWLTKWERELNLEATYCCFSDFIAAVVVWWNVRLCSVVLFRFRLLLVSTVTVITKLLQMFLYYFRLSYVPFSVWHSWLRVSFVCCCFINSVIVSNASLIWLHRSLSWVTFVSNAFSSSFTVDSVLSTFSVSCLEPVRNYTFP